MGTKRKSYWFDIRNVVKYDGKVIVPGGKRSTKILWLKIIGYRRKGYVIQGK